MHFTIERKPLVKMLECVHRRGGHSSDSLIP